MTATTVDVGVSSDATELRKVELYANLERFSAATSRGSEDSRVQVIRQAA